MTTPLQTLWQTLIESSIETGQTPVLDLDLSPGILPSLTPLLALSTFASARLDMTTPHLVTGGESSGWLVALLATPHTTPPQQAPGLAVVYGGADQATHLASVAIYQPAAASAPGQRQRELPPGFAPWFAPAEHAGAATWAAWPFTFWAERSSQPRRAQGQIDQWLPWAGLLLAVGLVLAALLV